MRLILTIGLVLLPSAITRAADGPVDFVRDVRPILSDNCFKCHGPDENARQADLRLDVEKSARAALGNGKPKTSELIRRILSGDPDEQMPPPASKLSLTPGEIAILQRWVREGGRFAAHWSFQPVGDVKPPMVRQADWVRNPIDRFVLASLEQQQLKPNREASRQRLIRRVSFDLTGLPPTLKEIDAFLADKSEQA
ncbi:MAG: DUF1549 domain-containing protein, partial [Planctomycetaceae bacterium]